MKCDTCAIGKKIQEERSKQPTCCMWLMDNVVCGSKSVDECDVYVPIKVLKE